MYRFEIPFEKIDRLLGSKRTKVDSVRWEFLKLYLDGLLGNAISTAYNLNRSGNTNAYTVQIFKEANAHLAFNKLVNYDEAIVFFPLSSENIVEVTEWLESHCAKEDYYIDALLGHGLDVIFLNKEKAMQYKLSQDVSVR